jgi:predicted  nucleic acid-binding Zn-ribbon protein
LINIELKNHTVEKQIKKLQEDLKTSTSVVEQTKIRKNINILEKQREENEHQMVTGKERLLEAENELSTLKEELLSMEQLLYDKQRER